MLSVLLIYFNVTHEYHQVKGLSMTPTLNNYSAQEKTHDSVFVSKVKKYKRGDIVVIDKDNDGKNLIIKRFDENEMTIVGKIAGVLTNVSH